MQGSPKKVRQEPKTKMKSARQLLQPTVLCVAKQPWSLNNRRRGRASGGGVGAAVGGPWNTMVGEGASTTDWAGTREVDQPTTTMRLSPRRSIQPFIVVPRRGALPRGIICWESSLFIGPGAARKEDGGRPCREKAAERGGDVRIR